MSQKATIHDVAHQARVSVSSVSRALNNYPHVSEALKTRVVAAAAQLDYQPDFLAHSLRRGETNSIGFLVGSIANPVISTIYEGAAEALATNGYAVTLVSSRNQADLDGSFLRLLESRQVSGLIVSSAAESPAPSRRFIQETNIPTVMLDREPVAGERVFAVQSDHASSIREAVFHLIANGHRHIGFIGGPRGFYPTRQRFRAYQEALHEAGIALRGELIRFASFTEADAFAEALLLLRSRTLPSALIVAGNIILIGALQALQNRQLRVGRDIALVACDDIHLTQLYQPPVSAIRRDLNLLGKTAARLLLQGIQRDALYVNRGDRVITLPTQLVIRESSDYLLEAAMPAG